MSGFAGMGRAVARFAASWVGGDVGHVGVYVHGDTQRTRRLMNFPSSWVLEVQSGSGARHGFVPDPDPGG